MCIEALFIIVKIWRIPRCPSMDEWIKKRWHINTMKYYSVIKNKGILPSATMWMDLVGTWLSGINQAEKDKYTM